MSPNDTAIPPESEVTTAALNFHGSGGRESTSVMAAGRGSARRGHGPSPLRREIAGAAEEGADLTRLEGAVGGGGRVRNQEQEVFLPSARYEHKGQRVKSAGRTGWRSASAFGFLTVAKANQLKSDV